MRGLYGLFFLDPGGSKPETWMDAPAEPVGRNEMAPDDGGYRGPFPLQFFLEGLGVRIRELPPYDRLIPPDAQAQMVGDHPVGHSDDGVFLHPLSSLVEIPAPEGLPRVLKD